MGTSQSGEAKSGSPAKFWNATPPKRLVLSWADPDDLADKSRVTFEIEAMEDMTCLTVTHDKFQGGFDDGWQSFLGLAARAFQPEILPRNRQGTQHLLPRISSNQEDIFPKRTTFLYVTYIRTTPEKLWQALTTRNSIADSSGTTRSPTGRPGAAVALLNSRRASHQQRRNPRDRSAAAARPEMAQRINAGVRARKVIRA